jgi:SAM-dependent methyltransferase
MSAQRPACAQLFVIGYHNFLLEMTMMPVIPAWAGEMLVQPGSHDPLRREREALVGALGDEAAKIEDGIICFPVPGQDPSIRYYEAQGGTRFYERTQVPYTMSSLDTPVYHKYLKEVAPACRDAVVVDIGSGDGRNSEPWLRWGFRRVILIDPIRASLSRFRRRIAAIEPQWLNNILLIQADARRLPLADGCADRVLAIETMCYLNEDSGRGIAECRRIMKIGGELLLSVRDYETGLLIQALYDRGVKGMLGLGRGRDVWDGVGAGQVRNRCFTKEEAAAAVVEQGLVIKRAAGISAFSVVLSFLRSHDCLGDDATSQLPEIGKLLAHLGETGSFNRTHVIFARRPSAAPGTRISTGDDRA